MEISDEYYKAFFKHSTDKYLLLARKFEKGEQLPFKFYAFLFGYFWIFFRKIDRLAYISIIFFFGFLTFISLVFEKYWIRNQDILSKGFLLVYMIIIGVIANYYYIRNARFQIIKIIQKESDTDIVLAKIRKKGGVSWISVLVVLAIQVGLILLGEYAKNLE